MWRKIGSIWLCLMVALAVLGCAQMRTSRITVLEKPEFYRGRMSETAVRPAALPVQLQAFKFPLSRSLHGALSRLQDSLNVALAYHLPVVTDSGLSLDQFPRLYLGVSESAYFPGDSDDPDLASQPEIARPTMVWYVESGSAAWRKAISRLCRQRGFSHLMVVFLGLSDFKVFQKDWKGRKAVLLGSDFAQPVPWLTSLQDPVEVVYVTAALVDAHGKVIRVGAEALMARPSNLLLSATGLQATITARDVENLLHQRRNDLVDRPLVWKHALARLVSHLLNPLHPAIRAQR